MRVVGALQAAALLTAVLGTAAVAAKKDEPTFAVTDFEHYPRNLNYFDDSDVILFQDISENNVYRSADAGATWARVETVPEDQGFMLVMHEYDNNKAYILTSGIQHYRTADQGKTWEMFLTDAEMSMFRREILQFHAGDPDRILFNGMDCQGIFCEEVAMYTTDGFRSDAKFLRGNTAGCWWAKSSYLFTTSDEARDNSRILCIVRDSFSPFKQDQRLLISDNYFSALDAGGVIQESEPNLDGNKPMQGIVNIAVVKKYLMVATTSLNTDEMALFVTDDTEKWHRAMFSADHKVMQEAYTVLESTNYSIQIDVMTTRPSNPMGVMFSSNSNGTYFTRNIEHTNRNFQGHVDFEKIAGIQGIFLVNMVENWEAVEKEFDAKKHVVSEITFDDGRSFDPVMADGQRLHLHSITDLSNIGRVFSSPAPGLVMAVGNTGDSLGDYWKGNLYISDNAGVSWIKGLDGPHKYEFGDQGSILCAVRDSEEFDVGEIRYSLDHGQTWKNQALPDGLKMKPWFLTTVQDSTSLKFLLVGEKESAPRFPVVSIDFDGLHEATCKESDLEDWYARVDDKGEPSCLMGHTQMFHRRKKTAECFMKAEFRDPVVVSTDCDCTDMDFECDYNFARTEDRKECVPAGLIAAPEGACTEGKPDETFQGSSGWRRIPGNTCKRASGPQKDDPVERKCSDSVKAPGPPASGDIEKHQIVFEGDWEEFEFHYLERGDSSSTDDETIIVRPRGTSQGPISITQDHGKSWQRPEELMGESIWAIIPHFHFKEVVFFVTTGRRVIYTIDRGVHFHSFKAPSPAAMAEQLMPLAFHPDKKDWLLWMGKKCDGDECAIVASYSKDRGDHWETAARYVGRCEFTGGSAFQKFDGRKEDQIVCLQRTKEDNSLDNPWQLVSTEDWFDNREVHLTDVKDFATMAEFILAATEDSDKGSLQAHASLDGQNFATARFPNNFEVPHQRAYSVLESSTHAVMLFVATETKDDRQHGSILKSNSNGTSYVLSVAGVNCDNKFYVDFEKMMGLEGVAVVNVVANPDENAPKKLQTRITHNDGAEWTYLPPPKVGADDKPLGCSSTYGDTNCALHIHGYTERRDRRKTYSSESAVGLMFGWGNVGSELGPAKDADTYMTTDGGISWKQAMKGRWTWAFGDQGSIIVLVQTTVSGSKTDTIYYSINEGATWVPYKISDEKIEITDISTLRSGGSRNFLLWAKEGSKMSSINVDFSGLSDRVCKYIEKDPVESDYYIWSPSHPLQPNGCLFGHKSQYLRKKPENKCHNDFKMQHLYSEVNCTCTRLDFECDYNYELDSTGSCQLVKGLEPLDPAVWCKQNPDAIEYYEPTGYRRIPLTTCVDGLQFDKASTAHPCKGHEDEFDRAHSGPSGLTLFFAITIPIAAAVAVGWYVWRNWSGQFGQIRLGEQGGPLDADQPWVRYPVIAVSALVAIIGALPLVVQSVWRTARGGWSRVGGGSGTRRFTTRDSFARGRGDYAIVDDDEGELLGDDSDEEV